MIDNSSGLADTFKHSLPQVEIVAPWMVILRRPGLVAVGLATCLILAVLYYFQATVIYESESQLLVMKQDSSLASQGQESSNNFTGSVVEDTLSTHIEMITSPRIVSHGIQKYQLYKLPSIVSQLKDDITPTDLIIENLEASRGGQGSAKGAHVLNMSLKSISPEDSQTILNAIVESYQEFLSEKFQDSNKEALDLISRAKDEVAEELAAAEKSYQVFREKAPLLWNGTEKNNLLQQKLLALEMELSRNELKRADVKARLRLIQDAAQIKNLEDYSDLQLMAMLDDSLVQRVSLLVNIEKSNLDMEAYQAFRIKKAGTEHEYLVALRNEHNAMLRNLGSDHPLVKKNLRDLKEFESLINSGIGEITDGKNNRPMSPVDLVKSYIPVLKKDLEDLDSRDADLRIVADREMAAAKSMISFELQEESLRNEISRKQELYTSIVSNLHEVDLVKNYGGYVTEVLSPVELGEQIFPTIPIVLGIGGVLGILFGCGLAFIVEAADTTFRDPKDVSQTLDLPVVAHVANLAQGKKKTIIDPRIDQTVVAFQRPKSPEAEVFRGLRSTLFFGNQDGNLKVIQISSPTPGDGKTTISTNLAVSLAQTGKKVLLVDCDMRRPKVHTLFSFDRHNGLSSILTNEVEIPDAIRSTPIQGLSVLTAGEDCHNPAELLHSPQFRQFVEIIREQYDYILLDSPPVLAVSDPLEITAQADAVLLVVRIRKNGRNMALQAKETLAGVDAGIIGVAINDLDTQRKFGNGYGYYSYGYGTDTSYYENSNHEEAPEAQTLVRQS